VPLGFLRRRRPERRGPGPEAEAAPGSGSPPGLPAATADEAVPHPVTFEALTEEWRLTGRMVIRGRLSDALNRREPIEISDVQWGPADGSAPLEPAPGLKSVDPYDLVVVLGGPGSLPPLSEEERAALRVHKVPFDVALEAPPFRVVGTVHLYPGWEPERLLEGGSRGGAAMFVPVTDAQVTHQGNPIPGGTVEIALVNRFYLRGVVEVDRRTGQPAPKLPGQPLGGTSWRERSR